MRVIRGCVTIIGIVSVLAIVTVLMAYYLYSLSPRIRAQMVPVAVTAEAAQSLDQKIETLETEIDEAVAAGQEREMSFVVTEKELNSKLIELLAEGELQLNEVLVNFREGYFLVYAVVDVPGVAARMGAKGHLQVVDGDAKVLIEDFDLGKLPMPQSANSGIEQLLDIMISLKLADLPLELTGIEINNGELTASGLVKTAD